MKQNLKRLIALCLVLALCPLPAFAREEAGGRNAAQALYELGLFRGTGTNEQGEPVFDLDRTATRAEALTMLIRLLGKEQAALAFDGSHPFTDVPEWADRYVAYAYHEKLTNGIGGGLFGSQGEISANAYATFVLRALGYDDAAPDAPFNYDNAAGYAVEIGLTDTAYETGAFLRGDAAEVSLRALGQKRNGSDETLIQTLVNAGAVGIGAARAAGFSVDPGFQVGETVSVPVSAYQADSYNATYEVRTDDLRALFPGAYTVTDNYALTNDYAVEHISLLREEPQLYASLLLANDFYLYQVLDQSTSVTLAAYSDDDLFEPGPNEYVVQYVLDRDMNAIGIYRPGLQAEGQQANVTFTRVYIETGETVAALKAMVDASVAWPKGDVRVDWDDPHSAWDDGGGMAHTYPVYVNGKEIADRYYVRHIVVDHNYSSENLANTLWYDEALFLVDPPQIRFPDADDPGPFHEVFSSEGQFSYNNLWDARGNLLESHYGARYYERLLRDPNITLYTLVYDQSKTLVGYDVHNG